MDINEINEEITRLENSDTNWSNVERLSWLYTVRSNMGIQNNYPITSPIPERTDSEFVKAASGVDINKFMDVLNEHMDVVKTLYPKEYKAVIDRLGSK